MEIDPMRQWKGVWRWYDETMLDCCRPLEQIQVQGITLPEFACLARCNGLNATLRRADELTKEQFISDIQRTCKIDYEYLCVSFSRKSLNQTGEGHFSPIGGYNQKENMVLIMDVARFKYPSYWVSLDLLWESLQPIDSATQKPRGYIILSKGTRLYVKSAFSHLSLNYASWPKLASVLFQDVPDQTKKMNSFKVSDFISLVISSIPDEYYSVVEDKLDLFIPPMLQHKSQHSSSSEQTEKETLKSYLEGLDQLLQQVSSTKLYKLVSNSIALKKKIERIDSVSSLEGLVHSPLLDVTESLGTPRLSALRTSYSRRESYASIVPPSHKVNDFNAFLTMFMFALFAYFPLFEHVPIPEVSVEMKELFDYRALPEPLCTEVKLLKDQITALECSKKE
jgi:hypothetical protein